MNLDQNVYRGFTLEEVPPVFVFRNPHWLRWSSRLWLVITNLKPALHFFSRFPLSSRKAPPGGVGTYCPPRHVFYDVSGHLTLDPRPSIYLPVSVGPSSFFSNSLFAPQFPCLLRTVCWICSLFGPLYASFFHLKPACPSPSKVQGYDASYLLEPVYLIILLLRRYSVLFYFFARH